MLGSNNTYDLGHRENPLLGVNYYPLPNLLITPGNTMLLADYLMNF